MKRAFITWLAVTVLVSLVVIPVLAQTQITAAGCPGAPAPRLTIGGTGRPAQVYSSLRAAFDSNVILAVLYRANGDTFKVVSGPYCGSGPFNWWQVQYGNTTGWVTEGTGGTYWLEPVTAGPITPTPTGTLTITPTPTGTLTTPIPITLTPLPSGVCFGAPAPRLKIGGTGRPAQVFSSLRADFDSNVIVTVMYRANGDSFKVLAGPYCGTFPHNWWQVDYKGIKGWITEGQGSVYWVEPVQ